jgi:nucleotidyltransferase/DNA polymerase involved in DNA repair
METSRSQETQLTQSLSSTMTMPWNCSALSPTMMAALYADISSRVMQTLETLAPRVEVYSIDEAFLDLSAIHKVASLTDFAGQVKHTIGFCYPSGNETYANLDQTHQPRKNDPSRRQLLRAP